MNRFSFPAATAIAVAAAFAFAPAARAADDFKFVAPADCEPFPPDTSAAALRHTLAGLYNPGLEVERVLCPMPRDQDDPYLWGDVDVTAYYRAGTSAGRMACTLYVGSTSMQSTSVYSTSASGPLAAAGARASFTIEGAGQSQSYWAVPVSMLCSIDPKVTFAGLFFNERGPTHVQ
jgi:hypothetical protein